MNGCIEMRYAIVLLLLLFNITCIKDDIPLTDLIPNRRWEVSYYIERTNGQTKHYIDRYYRLEFIKDSITIISQSGHTHKGVYDIVDDTLIITSSHPYMTGVWQMIEYARWGYDTERITFKRDNIEIGLSN
jgi:hypothetical protein